MFAFAGWLIFAVLVWVIGLRHPDIATDEPVRGKHSWLAWASVVMFVTTFSVAPIEGHSLIDMIRRFL